MIRYGITAHKLYLFICSTKKSIFSVQQQQQQNYPKKALVKRLHIHCVKHLSLTHHFVCDWESILLDLLKDLPTRVIFLFVGKPQVPEVLQNPVNTKFQSLPRHLLAVSNCQHQASVSGHTFAYSIIQHQASVSAQTLAYSISQHQPSVSSIYLLTLSNSHHQVSVTSHVFANSLTHSQNTICLIIKEQLNVPQCLEDVTDSTYMYSTYVVE